MMSQVQGTGEVFSMCIIDMNKKLVLHVTRAFFGGNLITLGWDTY